MSKAGKIFFTFSFFALILLFAARWVYGGWHPALWVPFTLFALLLAAGFWKDHRAIVDLLMRRSTKHGMNMGGLIVASIAALACVNYFASRYDKKFDWTSDRLNSLSEQSITAARGLRQDTELVLVFRKDQNPEQDVQRAVKDIADMYRNVSTKISYSSFDALVSPAVAQKFEYTYGPYVFYALQKDPTASGGERRVKIDPPTEEGITRALIKLGREKKKAIYFTRGHGEPLLDDKDQGGLSVLKDELSVTYEVKPLVLFETKNAVPADADVVAVIGPKDQFLPEELNGLRDFARRGGHLLIALDPGQRHNLANLTKSFGVEFTNEFVLDMRSQALQSAPSLVLGTDFAKGGTAGEITRAFPPGNSVTLFELASSLRKAPDVAPSISVEELIKTAKSTAGFPELKEKLEYRENGPHVLAMTVKGRLPAPGGSAGDAKEFTAVIFADSNFLGNRLIHNNLNRDLAGNSIAWLASDTDLISIRPKEPKGTKLNIPREGYYILILGLLGISIVLFGSSFAVWWRRRTA